MNDSKKIVDENVYVDKMLKWVTDIIVVVMIALFFLSILGERTEVPGNSMSPVLENGESVLINKLSYKFTSPDRFDVILFKLESDEETNYYIKRIVGLPGETVQIKSGRIYINGEKIKYNEDSEDIVSAGLASNEIVLDDDEYFVIGDNWNSSEDSRFEYIGNINKDDIIGKTWFRISPLDNIGFVK